MIHFMIVGHTKCLKFVNPVSTWSKRISADRRGMAWTKLKQLWKIHLVFKLRINMDEVLYGFTEVYAQAGPSADRKRYQCYQF